MIIQLEKETNFEEAIKANSGIITKVCYYFSSDREEFKDIRQEVLLNIWKGWENYRKDSKLSTWFYRVTLNTFISWYRKETKCRKSISINEIIDLPDESDDSYLEKYNEMHALIRKLDYEDRALILLWLDEKSYDEIAHLLGRNRNTIAVKLKRIKEKLVKMSETNQIYTYG